MEEKFGQFSLIRDDVIAIYVKFQSESFLKSWSRAYLIEEFIYILYSYVDELVTVDN